MIKAFTSFIQHAGFFVLLLLAGCSHDTPRVKPAPLPALNHPVHLKTRWHENIGKVTFAGYRLEPFAASDKIWAANANGELKTIDLVKGKLLAEKKLPDALGSGVVLDDDHLYVVNRQGQLMAFSIADNGSVNTTPLWKKSLSSEALTPVAAADDLVAAQTADGHLYEFNSQTGEQLWVYATELPSLTLRGGARPQFASGAVVAGFPNGKLVVIDEKTGLPIWEKNLAQAKGQSEFDQLNDVEGDFVINDNKIYVGNYQGQVAAIDLFSGRVLWTRDISTYAALAVSGEQVFVADSEGVVWALDIATGATVWSQPALKARQLSGPAIYQDNILVGDQSGYLHLLSQKDGHFVGREKLDSAGIHTQPQILSDGILVLGASGQLIFLE